MIDLIVSYWWAVLVGALFHPAGRALLLAVYRVWVAVMSDMAATFEAPRRRVLPPEVGPPHFTFEGAALKLFMDDKISAASLDTLIGEGLRLGIMSRVLRAPFDLDALLDAITPPKFQAPRPFIHQCDCKGVAGDCGPCDNACRAPGGPRNPNVEIG